MENFLSRMFHKILHTLIQFLELLTARGHLQNKFYIQFPMTKITDKLIAPGKLSTWFPGEVL